MGAATHGELREEDRLCAAYGLEGTHADWAYVPAGDLAKAIDKELPRALAAWQASRPNLAASLRESGRAASRSAAKNLNSIHFRYTIAIMVTF
jgi:hypothetical protein